MIITTANQQYILLIMTRLPPPIVFGTLLVGNTKNCFSGFVNCTPSFGSNSKRSLRPIKLPVLIEKLQDPNRDFRFNKVILTKHAKHFLDLASMPQSAEYWMMRWNGKPRINAGFLMCVVRAWDLKKPLLFCSAMNTCMYDHPITLDQINKLKSSGYHEIPSITKTLTCGDTGNGARPKSTLL
ncbi:hypothetical protein GQX74_013865 [Glossina fuscipes]|nr:hypothetical protein GQX74_013865 [Glossina fuscipes]